MKRIPTLDGWRGVAVLLVVLDHASSTSRLHGRMMASLGMLGVDIFFVLSGYIITRLLVQELRETGDLHIAAFYGRRAFRILPQALLYIGTLLVLSRFIDLGDFHRGEVVASLLFFRNYWAAAHPVAGPFTIHFWSLSIEEQFYLVWPALLLFAGERRALFFAAAGALLCAGLRLHTYLTLSDPHFLNYILRRTELRADGLMVGCILALLLARPAVADFVFRNFPKETPLLCGFPILLMEQHTDGNPSLAVYLLIAIALASTLQVREGLAFQWLNTPLLVWLGTISYSLYIWQALFLMQPPFGRLGDLPYNVLLALTLAILMYYTVEKPVIAIGRQFLGTTAMLSHGDSPVTSHADEEGDTI